MRRNGDGEGCGSRGQHVHDHDAGVVDDAVLAADEVDELVGGIAGGVVAGGRDDLGRGHDVPEAIGREDDTAAI